MAFGVVRCPVLKLLTIKGKVGILRACPEGCSRRGRKASTLAPGIGPKLPARFAMTKLKASRRRLSSKDKDREFERLLRRAALYAKRHKAPAPVVSITRRKRVKAA